jgi:hypothetical protein
MNIIPKTLIDLASYIAIVGAILTALGFAFWACVVWTISNPYITYYNYKIKQYAIFRIYVIMTIVTAYGIINLYPK